MTENVSKPRHSCCWWAPHRTHQVHVGLGAHALVQQDKELLKVSKDKRALKFIKKRVGGIPVRGPGLGLGAQAHGPPCPAGGDTHPREEEERGAEQRLGRHEESGSQEGLKLSPPCTVNLSRKREKDLTAMP